MPRINKYQVQNCAVLSLNPDTKLKPIDKSNIWVTILYITVPHLLYNFFFFCTSLLLLHSILLSNLEISNLNYTLKWPLEKKKLRFTNITNSAIGIYNPRTGKRHIRVFWKVSLYWQKMHMRLLLRAYLWEYIWLSKCS